MTRKWVSVALVAFVLAGLAWAAASWAKDDGNDRVLSKVTFVHYRRGQGKPSGTPGKGGGAKQEGYYTYIANGAKWKVVEDFLLNPRCDENPDGELDELVASAVLLGMEEWETPGDSALAIYGQLIGDLEVSYDDGAYRGYNTISFEHLGDPQVIALTAVWGYFSGSPKAREIVEAHIVFNDDFEWGDATVDLGLMDVQNIATHELGHVAGMGDVYQSGASEETMYGYSAEGEIKKRDLYKGDIAGVINLYK